MKTWLRTQKNDKFQGYQAYNLKRYGHKKSLRKKGLKTIKNEKPH